METYEFKEEDGRIVTINELNTRMGYTYDNGEIAVWPTIKSQIRYSLYQKTRPIRNLTGAISLTRHLGVR
jgi:hypothetical protein